MTKEQGEIYQGIFFRKRYEEDKDFKGWQRDYDAYRSRLHPNRKSAGEVLAYLKGKYPVLENTPAGVLAVVTGNILENDCCAQKIPPGQALRPIALTIPNEGSARPLYLGREALYAGVTVIVGLEEVTRQVFVEGSPILADELTAFGGLDEWDLENIYLVSNYVRCLNIWGLLDEILGTD